MWQRIKAVVYSPEVAVPAGTTVISLILSRFFERQRAHAERAQEVERETRAKKIPVYEDFVGFWLDALLATKLGKKPLTEQQVMQGVIRWTKPILMWGSDDVVREWGQLRVELAEATLVTTRGSSGLSNS